MIRLLTEEDAGAYAALRREALTQSPLAFSSSPDEDVASTPESAREQLRRAPESVILGCFAEDLVGAIGLYRDRHRKAAHKAYLWGMYVVPPSRRQGIGKRLLEAALRHAGLLPGVAWMHLSVSSAAIEAQKLYESAGFERWGTEPDSLRHDGHMVAELHMALRIGSGIDL